MDILNEYKSNPCKQENILHYTCARGNLLEIQENVRHANKHDINQHDKNGFTPLHLAVVRNAYFTDDIIEILLTKGANVNARSQTKSDTPLHLAVQYANMPQVESTVMCLLENGGDPQLRNKELRSPYDYAMLREFEDLSNMLQDIWESRDSDVNDIIKFKELKERQAKLLGLRLIEALICQRHDEVQWCLSKPINVNTRDQDGLSALHYAVSHLSDSPHQMHTLHRMLNKPHADVNVVDKNCGNTPMHLAIQSEGLRRNNKMAEVVRMCITHGAKSSIRNQNCETALDLAKERNYDDIIHILERKNKVKILHKTNNNIQKNVEDLTDPAEELCSLHAAFLITEEKKRFKELASLLRQSTDVNITVPKDISLEHTYMTRGDTALHMAVRCNHTSAVQLLLNNNADTTITNADNETPYQIAESAKHTDILKILDAHSKRASNPNTDSKKCIIS